MHPLVSRFTVSSVIIGESGCFNYFDYFEMLGPLVCLDILAWLGDFRLWVCYLAPKSSLAP